MRYPIVAAILIGVCSITAPLCAQERGAPSVILIRTPNEELVLGVMGRLQYDSRVFLDEGTGTSDNFFLRRVAPGFQATFFRRYGIRAVADLSTGVPLYLEASASARITPSLQLRVGKSLVPVGLGQMQGISSGTLAEHGLGSALAPARDVGVELTGTVAGVADLALGLYNGVPDGVNGEIGWSGDKDVAARAFIRPFAPDADHPLRGLGFGIGGSHGEHIGSVEDPFLPAYRSGGRERYFRYHAGDDPARADGTHLRYSPQAYLYSGSIGILAEYLVSAGEVRRGDEEERLTHRGWQLVGSWVPTGENASYNGVRPVTRFDPRAGTWGAIELAVRLDGLRVDPDAFPVFADPALSASSAHSVTGGINWHPARGVRLLVNYQVSRFGAAPGAERRTTERALISRLQFAL